MRRLRRVGDDVDAIAVLGALDHPVQRDRDHDRKQDRRIEPRVTEGRELRRRSHEAALRERRVRIAEETPRCVDHVIDQTRGNVREEQGGDDLARTESGTHECRHEDPCGSSERTEDQHEWNHDERGQVVAERDSRPCSTDHAEVELALTTDVVHVHLERECSSDSGANQHRRERQRVGQTARRGEAVAHHVRIRVPRRIPRGEEEDRTEEQGREHAREGNDRREALGCISPLLEGETNRYPHDYFVPPWTPAMAAPTVVKLAVSPGVSCTIDPR